MKPESGVVAQHSQKRARDGFSVSKRFVRFLVLRLRPVGKDGHCRNSTDCTQFVKSPQPCRRIISIKHVVMTSQIYKDEVHHLLMNQKRTVLHNPQTERSRCAVQDRNHISVKAAIDMCLNLSPSLS